MRDSSLNPARTLRFLAKDLPKDVTLMCTFRKVKALGSFRDQHQTCWRSVPLYAKGRRQHDVKFTGETAFFIPQTDQGSIITSASVSPCGSGQRVRIKIDNDREVLSHAERSTSDYWECLNTTGTAVTVGLGLTDADGSILTTALVWRNCSAHSILKCNFDGYLRIYATDAYLDGDIIPSGEINEPLVWEGSIYSLTTFSSFRVTIDSSSGRVEVKRTV